MTMLARAGAAAMQSARRAPAPGPGPLLDYALDTTLSRTSEASLLDLRDGWAWGSPPWPGPATHRVFGDGAILIEGSRTNVLVRSEEPGDAAWLSGGGASGGNGTALAPDGEADAGTVSFPADAAAALYQAPAIADGTTVTLSAWLRGSGAVRLAVRQRDGSTVVPSANLLLTPEWVRHTFAVSVGSGASDPRIMILNGSDGAARTVDVWGVQCEEGGFATSYIRTAGVAATRGREVCTLADADVPAAMRTGKWAFDFWPQFAPDDLLGASGYKHFVMGFGSGSRGPFFYSYGSSWVFGLARLSVDLSSASGATFAPGDKVTVTVDFGADTWGVEGLGPVDAQDMPMGGNVSFASGPLYVGSQGGSNYPADSIISQPRAL